MKNAFRQLGVDVSRSSEVADGRGSVVFIHGMWLHPSSWQRWADLFDDNGYDTVSVVWPRDGEYAGPARPGSKSVTPASAAEVIREVAWQIDSVPRRSILIGHGVGASIARAVSMRVAASAAVAIAPVPLRWPGIRPSPGRNQLWRRHAARGLRRPVVELGREAFHTWFANAVSRGQSDDLYARFVVPTRFRPATVWGGAAQAPTSWVTSRAPSLLVAGGRDRIVPERRLLRLLSRYRRLRPLEVNDCRLFPTRGHSLTIDEGWREVANRVLDWLTQQDL